MYNIERLAAKSNLIKNIRIIDILPNSPICLALATATKVAAFIGICDGIEFDLKARGRVINYRSEETNLPIENSFIPKLRLSDDWPAEMLNA